jgi:hypothetical protein
MNSVDEKFPEETGLFNGRAFLMYVAGSCLGLQTLVRPAATGRYSHYRSSSCPSKARSFPCDGSDD